MKTRQLSKSARVHQAVRLAGEPHSIEAVEVLCAGVEAVSPDLPGPVREYLAAVRAWAQKRRDGRVMSCTAMAWHTAHYIYGWRLDMWNIDREDAYQEGMAGLIHAANLFDERRGLCFTTYATWWVRQAIRRLLDNASLVHVPVDKQSRAKFAEDAERARRVMRLSEAKSAVEDGTSGETLVLDHRRDHRDISDNSADVAELLRCLPPRERLLIEMRYLEGMNLEEAGKELGNRGYTSLTKERARQLIDNGLERIRLHHAG